MNRRRGKIPWKKSQKVSYFNKNFTLGLTVLSLLVLLVIISKAAGFAESLKYPFRPDSPADIKAISSWDRKSSFNLAVRTDRLYILSFNFLEKSFNLLELPEDTYLNLPFGFGRWSARSVYNLGQAENPPIGAKLLSDTLSLNFGLPVDGYLLFPEEKKGLFLQILEKERGNPFSYVTMLKNVRTDLTLGEMINLFFVLRGTRHDKLQSFNLAQSSLTEWMILPDGSRVLGLSQVRVDQFIQKTLPDEQIKNEDLSIGIFNTTNRPGLAERVARLANNLGGRVLFTANLPRKIEKSVVLGDDSYTTKRLIGIFAPDCEDQTACRKAVCDSFNKSLEECNLKDLDSGFSRSEVNILLGEDFYLRYNK